MAGVIKVNTDLVGQIANEVEKANNDLKELLTTSQQTMNNLSNTWEGEASRATLESYDSFAKKYFDNYYDIIDSYVKFLRSNVEQGYTETETSNTGLADAFA